jgi:hypothetical protein
MMRRDVAGPGRVSDLANRAATDTHRSNRTAQNTTARVTGWDDHSRNSLDRVGRPWLCDRQLAPPPTPPDTSLSELATARESRAAMLSTAPTLRDEGIGIPPCGGHSVGAASMARDHG